LWILEHYFYRWLFITCGVFVLFGDYQFYNVLITSHGLIMIFAFIMPIVLGGFTNYWLPLFIGCPDMLFPRINNLSFWLYFLGVLFVVFSLFIEEGVGIGWTLYPTLLCIDFHSSCAVDFAIFAVHLLGLSSIINSINIIGTLISCRRRYYCFFYISLFIWGILITAFLLILCLPVLAGGVTLILFDRNFNTGFYDVLGGGDLVLFQHLFWFFGHPEVYIIIMPIFGFISTVIEFISVRVVFSVLAMIYSMSSISLLGFFVWAHHMFTVGLDLDSRVYFGIVTLLIGVPTCIKIFNWLFTIWSFDLLFCIDIYFVYMFLFMFLIGGITGLLLANVGLDILLHDTYFVVAHFHYVLSLGAVIGVFSGFLHFLVLWLPCEFYLFYIYCLFILIFFGANMVFFPLHCLGLLAFPRRISDYPISYLWLSVFVLFGLLFLCFFVFFIINFFFIIFIVDCIFFIFLYSFVILSLFFYYFIFWLPICCLFYGLLCDFLHLILDCFCLFLFFLYFFFVCLINF
jgi:heme/copper-type cytochrome/quinol oxidase subunit 1